MRDPWTTWDERLARCGALEATAGLMTDAELLALLDDEHGRSTADHLIARRIIRDELMSRLNAARRARLEDAALAHADPVDSVYDPLVGSATPPLRAQRDSGPDRQA